MKDNQKFADKNAAKVIAFPAELEEAVKKAREEAIKETNRNGKSKLTLWRKNRKVVSKGMK
ncbi:MAG: hypothetical protein LH474_05610 [Chamaesiphon sp.]|nr:hypothetical protein [Chamaesiphon sp.]